MSLSTQLSPQPTERRLGAVAAALRLQRWEELTCV